MSEPWAYKTDPTPEHPKGEWWFFAFAPPNEAAHYSAPKSVGSGQWHHIGFEIAKEEDRDAWGYQVELNGEKLWLIIGAANDGSLRNRPESILAPGAQEFFKGEWLPVRFVPKSPQKDK